MDTWFKLPYVGGDVFRGLRASRVDYETGKGFRFTASTNLERACAIISEAIHEPVEVDEVGGGKALKGGKQRVCFICGEPRVPEVEKDQWEEEPRVRTICDECLRSEDAYPLYVLKFSDLMNEL